MVELIRDNPIAAVIVLCEFGFWALVVAGLAARYLLRLRRLSAALLVAVPLVDVVLVVAVLLDLHRGSPATAIHGLAAVYLGFSVAFGPALVRWADRHFAHRFAGGPKPHRPAKGSPERYRAVWQEWYRVVAAAAIASVTLLGMVVTVAGPEQEAALWWWIGRVWMVVGIWFLAGPAFERRPSEPERTTAPTR
ncbi:hypothetical protein SAMN05443637_102136 [Pseudonocardia thermophila]|mgnify:CR=1 FL=1|jgi:hypothetical protein|uniref:Uncharacterized protein n=1 Tax=Pseudonocardia thermophila TaxID=1848 RepID=A0A1M6P9V2_PSETH|nr:hypothetical protein [Pseudonocardia thermophila]SHK04735.1 hypothetical protein SAMN05443637_102136 [Pseudonocardia thermophila]